MKKALVIVLVVVLSVVVSFLGMALAEDKAEFQKFMVSLDKLEKGCPYSFSEELFLDDILQNMLEMFRVAMLNPSLPKEDLSQLSILKTRIEEILAGPCCGTIRSLEKVQEMLFDLQKSFGTPPIPAKQWWEGLD